MNLWTGRRRSLLRPRGAGASAHVEMIELFFDLVFVFAITQVSHTLLANLSIVGAIEAALLFVAIWWVWVYTAWVTNWLDPERRPVRIALLALMLVGLVLSIALPQAFAARGLVFACAYVTMQVGRTLFMIWAIDDHPGRRRDFQRIACWSLLSGAIWIAGGLADPQQRLRIWAVAVGVELLAPILAYRVPGLGRAEATEWDIDASHLAERCALFILIGLGESLVMIGATFAAARWDGSAVIAFASAFFGAIALWWIYFDTAAENTSESFVKADNPGALARVAYTYAHAAIVAGIVVVAVGDERLLARPQASSDPASVAAILGGPALFLISNAWFRWLMHPRLPRSHMIGLALLAMLAVAAGHLNLAQLGVAVAATLLVAAASGTIFHARRNRAATDRLEQDGYAG